MKTEILAKSMEEEWKFYNKNSAGMPHPVFFDTLEELLEKILGRKVQIE